MGAVDGPLARQDEVERGADVGVAAGVLEDLVLVVVHGLLRRALVDDLDLEVDARALLDLGLDGLGEDVAAVPERRSRGDAAYREPLAVLDPEALAVALPPAGSSSSALALAVSPPKVCSSDGS